ncbi:MAG: type III-B CRISPR module RAMP protein Cmr1 [candidate division WOR-3 bacterium]
MVEKIIKIKTVTPMFLGNVNKKAEMKVTSLKGVLRYWWRASTPNEKIEKLFEKEMEIFGGIKGEKGQKSKLSIILLSKSVPDGSISKEKFYEPAYKWRIHTYGGNKDTNVLSYLSYGAVSWDKNIKQTIVTQEYFKSNTTFEFKLVCDNDKIWNETEKALKCIHLFGGLGAKSRNGFGSVEVWLDNKPIIGNDNKEISNFIDNIKGNNEYKYPTFSKQTIVWKTKKAFLSWEDALKEIGEVYIKAKLGLDDHYNYTNRRQIALPISALKNKNDSESRDAKVYFLKVIKKENGFVGQILFLPYIEKSVYKEFNNNINSMNKMEVVYGR